MTPTIEEIKQACREIIELAEKATSAPWRSGRCDEGAEKRWFIGSKKYDIGIISLYNDTARPEAQHESNAAFIAQTRSFTPAAARSLLVAIDALESIHATSPMGDDAAWEALESIRQQWEGAL